MSDTRPERCVEAPLVVLINSLDWREHQTGVAELGDDVTVVTPDVNPPKHYFGARVRSCGSDILFLQIAYSWTAMNVHHLIQSMLYRF